MKEYLFHYTERSKAICILKTGQLRLSPFTKLNDPKEYKEWVSFVVATKQTVSIKRDDYKVLCFSQGSHPECPNKSPLEAGYAMGNMWAHYGNKFDGLCLVFDKNKLDSHLRNQFGTDKVVGRPVEYNDDLQAFSNAQADDPNVKPVIDYLLFHKFNWWSNEKEYRWVVKCSEGLESIYVKYLDRGFKSEVQLL